MRYFFLLPLTILIFLIFAIGVPVGFEYSITQVLFGLNFKVDFIAKQFLIFTSFVWFVASIYAFLSIKSNHISFFVWFIGTFLGNFFLCISYDSLGFYLFFSIMTFFAFGLIIHSKTETSQEAAISYIKFAIFGEILIFIGIVIATHTYGGFSFDYYTKTNIPHLGLWALLIGFSIKAGMFMVHSWLPLAHSSAPVSASAVLSGVMLKAGILGWLRFFPNTYDETAGRILVTLGLLAIFGGIYGIFQKKIKVVLAYSSIAQMGYLVVSFGIYLITPIGKEAILVAIIFFVIHHGINKAGLFLISGDILKNGLTRYNLIITTILAANLVGLPLTSGMVAKDFLKNSMDSDIIVLFLSMGSFVTALLMGRFIVLASQIKISYHTTSLSFVSIPLLMASLMLPFWINIGYEFNIIQVLPVIFAIIVFWYIGTKSIHLPHFPVGDMLNLLSSIRIEQTQIIKTHKPKKYLQVNWIQNSILWKYLEKQKVVFVLLIIIVVLLSFYSFYSIM